MINTEFINTAREYLGKGRIHDCISTLKGNITDDYFVKQILQAETRLNSLERRRNTGIIDHQDAQLEENQISNALIQIISDITKDQKEAYSVHSRSSRSFLKISFFILVGCILLSLTYNYFSSSSRSDNGIVPERPIDDDRVENSGAVFEDVLKEYSRGNHVLSLKEFGKLAEEGDPVSQWHFGEMLYHGEGVLPDSRKGLEWIRKSANQGYSQASGILGLEYYRGNEVLESNYDSAQYFLTLAANKGNIYGYYGLGLLELYVKGNASRAETYFRKAANKGLREAQYEIGSSIYREMAKLSEEGNLGKDLVDKYLVDAMVWYTKAKNQEHPESMLMLAICTGALDQVEESYYYYQLYGQYRELNNVHKDALNDIKRVLTTGKVQELNRRAQNFKPSFELEIFHSHFMEI